MFPLILSFGVDIRAKGGGLHSPGNDNWTKDEWLHGSSSANDAQGHAIAADPSGEIYQQTSGHLHRRGFAIRVLQPADTDRSERFNPLAFWSNPQELRQLATILGMSVQGCSADPFWATAAVNLLWLSLAARGDESTGRAAPRG